MKLIRRLRRALQRRHRLLALRFGWCPLCNSSPPWLDCPVCEGSVFYGHELTDRRRAAWRARWDALNRGDRS